ncbi:hypothetical protein CR513_53824, partial [Mucuna pruriens]
MAKGMLESWEHGRGTIEDEARQKDCQSHGSIVEGLSGSWKRDEMVTKYGEEVIKVRRARQRHHWSERSAVKSSPKLEEYNGGIAGRGARQSIRAPMVLMRTLMENKIETLEWSITDMKVANLLAMNNFKEEIQQLLQ